MICVVALESERTRSRMCEACQRPRKSVLKARGSILGSEASMQCRCCLLYTSLRAVVAGEGPLFDGVQRRVERSGLGDWLLLPGRLSATQLQDLYARSDIFLAPSVKESASIAGREALASGLAVMM